LFYFIPKGEKDKFERALNELKIAISSEEKPI